jgi:D-alanyl-D-alanine carboxypeptidase/D-alanyl-D-alanine-endopeptidase (penicillin-binding protein 4)
MHQSDNFIAEQLLLLCAGQKTGILKQDTLIRWAKDSIFSFLPQKIRWVDGSGLSRYNLNTPQNNVAILFRLWQMQPQKRLFSLFPEGGNSGTLKGWYKSKDGTPYIYAKSGSMSGVQCLSGYLITRKGKVLIFSFMHNNFVGSGKAWKTAMQEILEQIRYD